MKSCIKKMSVYAAAGTVTSTLIHELARPLDAFLDIHASDTITVLFLTPSPEADEPDIDVQAGTRVDIMVSEPDIAGDFEGFKYLNSVISNGLIRSVFVRVAEDELEPAYID